MRIHILMRVMAMVAERHMSPEPEIFLLLTNSKMKPQGVPAMAISTAVEGRPRRPGHGAPGCSSSQSLMTLYYCLPKNHPKNEKTIIRIRKKI